MSAKEYLKAAKKALQDENYEYCLSLAQDALAIDPDNYYAHVFSGKSNHLMGHVSAAVRAYRNAIAIEPDNLTAWKGLVLAVKSTDDYRTFFSTMAKYTALATSQGHAIADCLVEIQRYVKQFDGTPGLKEEYLRQLFPDAALQQATKGLLKKPESALKEYLDTVYTREKKQMFQDVTREKMKSKVNRTQAADGAAWAYYRDSEVPYLMNELINLLHDDEERQAMEEELLKYKHAMLKAAPQEEKPQLLVEVSQMAEDMVFVKHPCVLAWLLHFDYADPEDISSVDPQMLKDFLKLFKTHPLAQIIRSFLMSDLSSVNLDDEKKQEQEDERPLTAEEKALKELTTNDEEDVSLTQDELLALMTQALENCKTSLFAHRIVLAFHVHCKKFEEGLVICQSAIQLIAQTTRQLGTVFKHTKEDYLVNYGVALTYHEAPKNHKRALEIFDKVLAESPDNAKARVGKGLILAERGELVDAEKLLKDVVAEFPDNEEAVIELSWVQIRLGEHEAGRTGLARVLTLLSGNSLYTLELKARVNWRIAESYRMTEDISKAYEHLVESLRSFANYAPSYTSLGEIYLHSYQDKKRAKRCFVKAFELDAAEVKAAWQLCAEATDHRDWRTAELISAKLLESENAKRCLGQDSWPYRILGCAALERQDAAKAVEWFQNAIRLDKEDTESWIGLGEAYAGCGRLEAGAKVFKRALELEPENWSAKYMLSMMQLQIGEFDDALEILELLLKERPNEECVISGMYETLYKYANSCVQSGFFGKAVGLALRAVDFLEKGNVESFNFWKVMSDLIQIFLQIQSKIDQFPHERLLAILRQSGAEIDEDLIQKFVDEEKPIKLVSQFLIYANQAAVALEPKSRPLRSSVFYNLGLAQVIAYLKTKDPIHRDSAIITLKNSIMLQNNYQEPWICLGIASMSVNPRVAQHCFIKATSIDQRNVETWSNLALLYFRYADHQLAAEAYMRGQSLAPTEPVSWLGHAFTAEADGDHVTASNLYTHAFVLSNGKNPSAQFAYGLSVCLKRIGRGDDTKDIEAVQELSTASYGMVQYMKHFPLDRFGLEVTCLILERLNDYELGREISGQLLELLEKSYEESEDETVLRAFCRVKAQVARFELGVKEYETAVESCLECLELNEEDHKTVISCRTVMGLAHFFMEKFDEALEEFKQVLTLSNDAKRLVVLIAQVLYVYDTEETREAALEQLFHNIETHGSSLLVTLVIGAISMIENLEDYLTVIKSELETLPLGELLADRFKNVPYLISLISERLGDKNSKAVWQKAAFMFPDDLRVWKELDQNIALKLAMKGKVTAQELSERYVTSGTLKHTQRALFFAPWNVEGLKTLKECF